MDGDTKGEKEKRFEEANILSFPCSRYRYLLGVSPGPRRVIYILPRGPFESVRSFFSPLRREGAAPLFSFLFFFYLFESTARENGTSITITVVARLGQPCCPSLFPYLLARWPPFLANLPIYDRDVCYESCSIIKTVVISISSGW